MKNFKTYISLLFAATLSLTACQDDFDAPEMATPESSWLGDADSYELKSIIDVKTEYWKDADNYYMTIQPTDEGKNVIVKGRVISSDAAGNIYKSLVIQDETGALAMSINANSMYNQYRRGQEVVVNLTGMTIGKYAGLQQLGSPEDSETYGAQTTFMAYNEFVAHSQKNGNPNLAEVDTLTVNSFSELTGGADVIRKWQSRLVRFNNCSFVDGGKETFASYKTTVSRTLTLSDGQTLTVRTSGYSNFYANVLPEGKCDVVGILSYFNSNWQLLLIDRNGCMNVGNPTVGPGAEDNPYTVDQAVSVIANGGTSSNVWTTGYIVGAIAPGVQAVSSNADIQFTSTPDLDNTIVIASDPECSDWTKCMVISLPQDSKLRTYGNLADNEGNYKKQIWIKGNFGTEYGDMAAIVGNSGASDSFRIDGVEVPGGDGGGDKPSTPTGSNSADFNTMNGGEPSKYYSSYTSTNGWTATNSQLLTGGEGEESPIFSIFGDSSTYAVCLNGKSTACGTLTSPTISGGLGTLTFDYCQPFSDTKCKLTVNIKQNGSVVASDVLENNGMTKLTKYTYTHAFNISGNFVIEIVNDAPSASTKNKDRVAVWNLTWTN